MEGPKKITKAKQSKQVKSARDKAWKAFSEYIRRRDNGVCVTCGARIWNLELGENCWQAMQAGHFRHGKFDFDEMNINCQCVRCNHFLFGNLGTYALYLLKKYGEDALRELQERDEISDKRTKEEWESLEQDYRRRIQEEDYK